MPAHQTPLIATIAAGLVLAYIIGLIAHRLRIQPLVGYLLAGVMVGPFTPGFVADQALASELAEIGVILLMFGVGLHFSLKDLMAVARVAVPGALLEISAATLLGGGLAWLMGWGLAAAVVFGLALSVASTAVVVRGLQERRMLETERGRIIVGWLVVEDLAMVVALVLLPALAGMAGGHGPALSHQAVLTTLGITLAKVAGFIIFMLVAGRRIIPWLMHYTAHTGSRELFRLAVYATALGIAFVAAHFFEASFALGAFVAGIVLGETKLSQRATEEAMPLRDAFGVLFFVSVGMLFNPAILLARPLAVLGTIAVIMLAKTAVVYGALRLFGYRRTTSLSVAARLGLIGEFSFILIGLGVALGLVPPAARDLVLAGAILSILLNPVLVSLADGVVEVKARVLAAVGRGPVVPAPLPEPVAEPEPAPEPEVVAPTPTSLSGHDIVVGHGRVGSLVTAGLLAAGRPVLVIEDRSEAREAARLAGAEVIDGNAATPAALALANLAGAQRLFVTIPESFEAGQVVMQARAANPGLEILARAHSDACYEHLENMGSNLTILGEREIAHRMLERARQDEVAELVKAE
ncbi:cation:proton antiporter domain-containing protein [Rhodovarius lipocyclicus]|uniref:YbaL family putative K(+) efflux transporter n=1 Tax=Rhodovarius lipocyclicus TaxID=268410 RepID=UPI001359AFC0|nr:YbaL family putative K(+) efflux transporter [Rhodovarius lipocyclicus]